jgi:very-short-patch-repair endonuclease
VWRVGWDSRGVCGHIHRIDEFGRIPLERRVAELAGRQWGEALGDVIRRPNGHRGTKRMSQAIQGDPQFTRGELEALMNKLARDHDLPQPECNTSVAADDKLYEVDCYFPTHRVVIETDGWVTHRTRHAFESDRAKDAALTAAGYTVVRFTWRQLRDDPGTVADRIKAILAYRAASASRNSASSESSIE